MPELNIKQITDKLNTEFTGEVRKLVFWYDTNAEFAQDIDSLEEDSKDSREISAAKKRKEKLQKQLKETKEYDAQIAHIALARIDIDLDDGVKVNYQKVQTAPDGKVMKILAKI